MNQSERVAIYCRTNAVAQDGGAQGLDLQRTACRQHLGAHADWTMVRDETTQDGVFVDVAGGRATTHRPAQERLLGLAWAGQVDVILVVRFDRLSRDAAQLVRIMEEFQALHVRVVSATEGEWTPTAGLPAAAIAAEHARILRTRASMARRGQAAGNRAVREIVHVEPASKERLPDDDH